jgi:integrase/recombinase XerD
MLRSLFPKAHDKYLSLPLLGPIVDGFDDWLSNNGFTKGSRVLSIHLLPVVDANLRRRGVQKAAKLTHAVLEGCCQALKKKYPFRAGTVHTLERYLIASAVMLDGQHRRGARSSDLSERYTAYLRDVRGFAASTISSHGRATQCFLRHLEDAGRAVRYVRPGGYRIVWPLRRFGSALNQAMKQQVCFC